MRKISIGVVSVLLVVMIAKLFVWYGAKTKIEPIPDEVFPELSYEKAVDLFWREIAKRCDTNQILKMDYKMEPYRGEGFWRFYFKPQRLSVSSEFVITVEDSGKIDVGVLL